MNRIQNKSLLNLYTRTILFFTCLCLPSLNIQAQSPPSKQWDKRFGGTDNDSPSFVHQTSDGGYILGGSSRSGLTGDKSQASKGANDFWIIKTNAAGIKVWDKSFGGSDQDLLTSVEITSDGGFILGGYSRSGISNDKTQPGLGMFDYWILKTDANGNKLWDKTFGGNGDDRLSTIKQTSDAGYILAGTSDSGIGNDKSQTSRGISDNWVLKVDPTGNKQWDKTIGGNNEDILQSVQQTADGGFVLAGNSISGISGEKSQNTNGGDDYWIVKLDNYGNKQWDKTIGGNNSDYLHSIQITSDGGYIIGGWSSSLISGDKTENNKGGFDYWIVKTDLNGTKIWDKAYGGNDGDYLSVVMQTIDGNYIIGGYSWSNISIDKSENNKGGIQTADFWILKVSSNGTKLWDKSFGGTLDDRLNSVHKTSDGGLILSGFSSSGNTGDKTQASQGYFDYWIVKLGPEILGTSETQPTFNLTISPNPNQGKFKLHLTNLTTPKAEVTIADLLGRKILKKQLQITDNQLSEELILPAAKGMYLLQLKAGEEVVTRKIVVE